MNGASKIINQYCKAVKKELSCPCKIKKDLIIRITPDLEAYIDNNPNASFDDISEQFGTPSEIAKSYLASLDEEELKKRLSKAKRIWTAVIMACTAITLLFAILAATLISDSKNHKTTFVTESISEDYFVSE